MRLLAVVALLAAGAAALRAQDAPIVVQGDRVRVDLFEGDGRLPSGEHVGIVEQVGPDTVWFAPERRDSVSPIAWSRLRRIDLSNGYLERSRAVSEGAAIGAGLGLVAAAIDFAAGGGTCSNLRDPSCFLTARGLVMVVSGAAVGGLIGVGMAGERWKQVYPVQVPVSLYPAGAGHFGVAASIRVR